MCGCLNVWLYMYVRYFAGHEYSFMLRNREVKWIYFEMCDKILFENVW